MAKRNEKSTPKQKLRPQEVTFCKNSGLKDSNAERGRSKAEVQGCKTGSLIQENQSKTGDHQNRQTKQAGRRQTAKSKRSQIFREHRKQLNKEHGKASTQDNLTKTGSGVEV